jgi:hypothetical protein
MKWERDGLDSAALVAAAVGFLAVSSAKAQESSQAPEYRIKAAFLYNFTLYTEWPSTAFEKADSPIVLAIAGEDPFGKELDAAVRGKTVRGRPIELRRFGSASEVVSCHVLYLSASEAKQLPQVLKRFPDTKPLTVAETEDFCRAGGVIRFFVDQNKVRFEVNTDAAARSRLKISSKLLHLARIVRDED